MANPIDEQTLLLGLARTATPADAGALAQLALMGQRRRFERVAPNAEAGKIDIDIDLRPILPDGARRLFVRLFADAPKSQSDRLEEGAVAALADAGYRLHPFDFAELEPLVLRQRSALGPAGASWAQMVRPRASDDDGAHDSAVALLRTRRGTDPAGARADLESVFPAYSAKERLAFLEALQVGLGPGDVPFLTTLTTDKAGTVRDRAAELLGAIPGTDAYATRLARARDHIRVETSGLVFKKKSLAVTGITAKSGSLWQLLPGLRLDDLAAALGLNGRTFIELAADTAGLSEVVLHSVLAEGRYDVVSQFEGQVREDGADWINMLFRLLPTVAPVGRQRLLEVCIEPGRWTRLPVGGLTTLHASWGGPLPVAIAGKFLNSGAWKNMVGVAEHEAESRNHGIPEALAGLVPVALSKRFIADVEPISRRAADYHRFLLALAEEAP